MNIEEEKERQSNFGCNLFTHSLIVFIDLRDSLNALNQNKQLKEKKSKKKTKQIAKKTWN